MTRRLQTVTVLLFLVLWSTPPAGANGVWVRVVADPIMAGGTLASRRSGARTWTPGGVLTGDAASDTLVLEDEMPFEVAAEKRTWWTVRRAEADYTPHSMLHAAGEDALVVHLSTVSCEPNPVGLASVAVPLVGLGTGWWLLVRRGYKRREEALWEKLEERERAALLAVRQAVRSAGRHLPTIDEYSLDVKLGSGGMATVYAVRDAEGRSYALKLPHPEALLDPVWAERFQREAQICMELNHPNIVRTLLAGTCKTADGSPVPYLVMERIVGTSLDDILRIQGRQGKPPDIKLAILVARGVLSALEAAHAVGVVHRDIKPSNVMITNERVVKLMDFGVARVVHARTKAGDPSPIGTPDFMAPEQIGSPASVDHRADLYSTGVLMFAIVTYRLPYDTEALDIMALLAQKMKPPPAPPRQHNKDVSPGLSDYIMKLMDVSPIRRFPTATAALQALEAVEWALEHPDRQDVT